MRPGPAPPPGGRRTLPSGMGDRRTADRHRHTAGVSLLKRGLLGRPLATAEGRQQRLRKLVALPIFSADAIA